MQRTFHKHKLLLDENMPHRWLFSRLNEHFDVKHIRDDLKRGGIPDPHVHALAASLKRLIVTYNAKDFKSLAGKSKDTGVIALSTNLPLHQIDTKLTALLMRSNAKALQGKFTTITGET
jgi:predicted nuclease of predicted toxin-antitoxin system